MFAMFAYELFKVKMKVVNNTRNIYISKYCSQIIVVNNHANGFHPICHNIAIKQMLI